MKTSTKIPARFHYMITLSAMVFEISCFGQDTIITRNGRSIIGHVVVVSTTEVKYIKAEIADGPLYTEDKSAVERINYKNGFSDIFPEIKPWLLPIAKVEKKELPVDDKRKPILERSAGKLLYPDKKLTENQLYHLMLSVKDPELNRLVKNAKRARALQYIGFAAIPFAGAALLESAMTSFQGGSNAAEENAIDVFAGCAVLSFGSSIYFNIDRKIKKARAIKLYREKYE